MLLRLPALIAQWLEHLSLCQNYHKVKGSYTLFCKFNVCGSAQGSTIRGHLKAASLGYAPALLTNIRLGWKGLIS
jgi:hypothetical protein